MAQLWILFVQDILPSRMSQPDRLGEKTKVIVNDQLSADTQINAAFLPKIL